MIKAYNLEVLPRVNNGNHDAELSHQTDIKSIHTKSIITYIHKINFYSIPYSFQ